MPAGFGLAASKDASWPERVFARRQLSPHSHPQLVSPPLASLHVFSVGSVFNRAPNTPTLASRTSVPDVRRGGELENRQGGSRIQDAQTAHRFHLIKVFKRAHEPHRYGWRGLQPPQRSLTARTSRPRNASLVHKLRGRSASSGGGPVHKLRGCLKSLSRSDI